MGPTTAPLPGPDGRTAAWFPTPGHPELLATEARLTDNGELTVRRHWRTGHNTTLAASYPTIAEGVAAAFRATHDQPAFTK